MGYVATHHHAKQRRLPRLWRPSGHPNAFSYAPGRPARARPQRTLLRRKRAHTARSRRSAAHFGARFRNITPTATTSRDRKAGGRYSARQASSRAARRSPGSRPRSRSRSPLRFTCAAPPSRRGGDQPGGGGHTPVPEARLLSVRHSCQACIGMASSTTTHTTEVPSSKPGGGSGRSTATSSASAG